MEAWTSYKMIVEGEAVYKMLKQIIQKAYSKALVEAYKDSRCEIIFKEILAIADDVVDFAEKFNDLLCDFFTMKGEETLFLNIAYRIEGCTKYSSYGSKMWFCIEKEGGELFIKETDNYDISKKRVPEYKPRYSLSNYVKTGKMYKLEKDRKWHENLEIEGKIFVLTGYYGLAFDMEDFIKSHGGIVKNSTVLDTDYLIYDEKEGKRTTKYRRALQLIKKGRDIKMIPGKKFRKIMEGIE